MGFAAERTGNVAVVEAGIRRSDDKRVLDDVSFDLIHELFLVFGIIRRFFLPCSVEFLVEDSIFHTFLQEFDSGEIFRSSGCGGFSFGKQRIEFGDRFVIDDISVIGAVAERFVAGGGGIGESFKFVQIGRGRLFTF